MYPHGNLKRGDRYCTLSPLSLNKNKNYVFIVKFPSITGVCCGMIFLSIGDLRVHAQTNHISLNKRQAYINVACMEEANEWV